MAVNWGGALSGAASGASGGSMFGPGWGTAIGAVGGGLMGMFSPDEEGTSGEAQWLQNPQWNTFEEMPIAYRLAGEHTASGLEALESGQYPTWLKNWLDIERKRRMEGLKEGYYGSRLTGPGILETQQAGDVAAGRRGSGAGSNYAAQLAQYGKGMFDIEDVLTQTGQGKMGELEQYYTNTLMNPEFYGPKGQWNITPGQAGGPSPMMQGLGALGALGGALGKGYFTGGTKASSVSTTGLADKIMGTQPKYTNIGNPFSGGYGLRQVNRLNPSPEYKYLMGMD